MAIVGLLNDEQTVARAVALFSALGDRSRLMIVRELARAGSLRVNELVARLALAQATVSGHLAVLRYSGLVTVVVQGNHRFYSLAHSQTLDLVSVAEGFLSGTTAALNSRCGVGDAEAPACSHVSSQAPD